MDQIKAPLTLSRRAFLGTSAVVAAGAAAGLVLPLSLRAQEQDKALQAELDALPPLRQVAADKGIDFGAAVEPIYLQDNDFSDAFIKECAILVPEWSLKWAAYAPTEGRLVFDDVDQLLRFAGAHGMKMRGHTLIWYAAMPDWAKAALAAASPARAEQMMESLCYSVAGRYRGRLTSWDVVNEAIEPKDNQDNGLRASPWLQAMGPDYIEKAFRLMAAVDPSAQRVYNDYAVEHNQEKADAMVAMLRRLKERDVPIQAVGLQAHLSVGKDLAPLAKLCKDIKDMELDLLITELDVEDTSYWLNDAAHDQRVADTARAFFDTVFSLLKPKQILTWGLSDRHTWLADPKWNSHNPLGLSTRPLPLDKGCRRKLLWKTLYQQISAL